MTKAKRYTVTSALPYANGPMHIGHIAGSNLPADIFARYLKLKGHDVAFICGSDEHGVAITLQAKKEGVSPQDIVDRYHPVIKESLERFGIHYDIYHRTSSDLHRETASQFFKDLYEQGEFFEKESDQYFDEQEQQFLADRYIYGECPNCSYDHAYGDQCERCGTSLSPDELKNPKSALSGNEPVKKTTKHWYLPLDKYQDEWLEDWVNDQKGKWKANVFGQCRSWLDGGLHPRAVTRDLDWGVPVPIDGVEGKVLYVWFDAPIGYISATKAWAEQAGKDWELYWKKQEDETENSNLIHFMGKDNIVFHTIIFPSMLKAHGDYILPENVPANEFLNLQGGKLSTSRNWAVWLHEYLDDLPGKEDVLRYTLTTIMPETKDSEFTWEDWQAKNNNELVAVLGNYINRVVVLTNKYFDGIVPIYAEGQVNEQNNDLIDAIKSAKTKVERSMEQYRFREALAEVMNLARAGNKHLADTEPWKLIKTDQDSVKNILSLNLQVIANLTILLEPFLPFTSQKILGFLNLDNKVIKWENIGTLNMVASGHQIGQPSLLFEKIEDDMVEAQIAKLGTKDTAMEENKTEPVKGEISFDDFVKLDIRVGTILDASKVEKADKLLQLTVDMGFEKRTVVSGIAEFFKPEDIIGKQVSVVANLAPRKIRGILSQGMILMAEDNEGQLSFVSPTTQNPSGSIIR